MSWTTPAQLKEQVRRRWERGEILSARVTGAALFPLRLKLAKPTSTDITERFDEVRRWTQTLIDESRSDREGGYVINWREVRHRVHGCNRVPDAVAVATETDALCLIGKLGDAERFTRLVELTLARYPELREWLSRWPLTLLAHAHDWNQILAVLDYFCAHPCPGRYLRQLSIAEVDTKFIETRKSLLIDLLDAVLPATAINAHVTGVKGFEVRYGLMEEPLSIRFRILDPVLCPQGLSDLSVPLEQFMRLTLPLRRVFITENKINGLAFPEHPDAIVVFGLGYGVSMLFNTAWLERCELYYWGDVDTHGFAMLSRLRARFPSVRSMLMDETTVLGCRTFWGSEPKPDVANLAYLTADEQAVYKKLTDNTWKERLRLEQERLPFTYLEQFLKTLSES